MKKYLIIAILLLLSLSSRAQETRVISAEFPVFQGVVTCNVNSADLFKKTRLWVAENFQTSSLVIQLEDAENKTIVINCVVQRGSGLTAQSVYVNYKVECKDGRFRYTFTINDIRSGTYNVTCFDYYLKKDNGETKKFINWIEQTIDEWSGQIVASKLNSDEW